MTYGQERLKNSPLSKVLADYRIRATIANNENKNIESEREAYGSRENCRGISESAPENSG